MKKKYDERTVLAEFKVRYNAELDRRLDVIKFPKNTQLSIHSCGKLDFLTKYCGWRVMFTTK
jgi:hypothetical protein